MTTITARYPNLRFVVTLLLVAIGVLCFATVARAEDPQFGTCWTTVCIGPRVAAPAMAIDLKTGAVQFGILPGFGYGIERAGPHIRWGAALFINTRSTADGERVAPSLMVDFMRYIHVGAMRQLGSGGRWFGLLTLGTDLGASPSSPAAAATPAK
jgi:hypothetical protein